MVLNSDDGEGRDCPQRPGLIGQGSPGGGGLLAGVVGVGVGGGGLLVGGGLAASVDVGVAFACITMLPSAWI